MLAAACLLLLFFPCHARPASSAADVAAADGGSRSRRRMLQAELRSAAPSPAPSQLDVATLPPGAEAAALSNLNLTSISLPTDDGTLVHSTDANGAPPSALWPRLPAAPHPH